MNPLKFSLAIGCTFAVPLLDRSDSILPASTSLKLLRVALGSLVICRAYTMYRQIPPQIPRIVHKLSGEDCLTNVSGDYKKWKIINELFGGCVSDLADLTLLTAANLAYPYFFVHEGGHYACAKFFFLEDNGRSHIPHDMHITPFSSGRTKYAISFGLTKIGQFMGKDRALKILMAGGMIASTLYSCGNIVLSRALTQRPYLSRFFFLQACSQSIQEFIYQCGFFLSHTSTTHHDLSQLQSRFQINPLYPLIALATAPILTLWVSGFLRCRKFPRNEAFQMQ